MGRTKRSLERSSGGSQRLMTEFINFEQTLNIVQSSPPLLKAICNLDGRDTSLKGASNFLQALVRSAGRNADRSKYGRRYELSLKLFATYIYVVGGLKLYETLQANLGGSLPSPSLVVTLVRAVGKPADEGVLRFKELKQFLEDRKLGNTVYMSEDGTVIVGRVEYDSRTGRLVGFVAPLDSNGLPDTSSFASAGTADEETIRRFFEMNSAAKYAYVMMAQPLQIGAPAFILGVFGTDNKFKTQDVINRWMFMRKKALEFGIVILGFSSDGDSRLLSAMRVSTFQQNPPIPDEWAEWFGQNLDSEILYVQDMTHVGAKFRTRLLKPSISLPMGNYEVTKTHLENVLASPKELHGLTKTDLNPNDKMNYRAVRNISSDRVLDCLRKQSDALGTEAYLTFMRDILDSYMTLDLTPGRRIFLIWRATFFFRLWRQWLAEEGFSTQDNFISMNLFVCIELNAHGLIQAVRKLRDSNQPHLFLPYLYSSQPCENCFRDARSLSSTNSTVVNFSLLGFLRRLGRIELQGMVATELGAQYNFPRETRRQIKGEEIRASMSSMEFPSDNEILRLISLSREEAVATARVLGMDPESEPHVPECLASIERLQATLDTEDGLDPDETPEGPQIPDDLDPFDVAIANAADCTDQTAPEKQLPIDLPAKSPFVSYTTPNGEQVVVRKSFLCWKYGGELSRISADRIHRFQLQQDLPNCQGQLQPNSIQEKETIFSGQWCGFAMEGGSVAVGRVLCFKYLTGRTERDRQYSRDSAPVKAPAGTKARGLGVLCSWFRVQEDGALIYLPSKHHYLPIENYICTIPPPEIRNNSLYFSQFITESILKL